MTVRYLLKLIIRQLEVAQVALKADFAAFIVEGGG